MTIHTLIYAYREAVQSPTMGISYVALAIAHAFDAISTFECIKYGVCIAVGTYIGCIISIIRERGAGR